MNIGEVHGLFFNLSNEVTKDMREHKKSIDHLFGPNEHKRVTHNLYVLCTALVDK